MGYKLDASMKGQITFTNLLALFITLIVYFVLAPVVDTIIEATVTDLESDPNEYTSLIVMLMRLSLSIILLAIIITAINYASPQREGYPPPPYG